MKKVLVTGGAGYLGSHMLVELIRNGYSVVCVDNLYNSDKRILTYVESIVKEKILLINEGAENYAVMSSLFAEHQFDAVIHFAGHKSVEASVSNPLEYYSNNYNSALTIIKLCVEYKSIFIFSSSATVYGVPESLPIKEEHHLNAINPYGRTKLHIEQILFDVTKAEPTFNSCILRYFNPVGGGGSGFILGEHAKDKPTNLMPIICQAASGQQEYVYVFGDDYPTKDGTGVRDYIHVVDLISGHFAALKKAEATGKGCLVYNLGTGKGISVLELIKTFEQVNGVVVPYKVMGRRAGDVASCYADPTKAHQELGWKASKTLEDMAADSWAWQKKLQTLLFDKH